MRKVALFALASAITSMARMPVTNDIGTKSGFIINNPFTYTGYTEMLRQFSNAFNAQSGGAIQLSSASKRGEIESSTFFQNIAGLIQRRDPSSLSPVNDKSVPMAQMDMVKVDRRVGPIAQTYDSFRKIGVAGSVPESHNGSGIDLLDFIVGQQTAKGVQVEMINTLLAALVAALRKQASTKTVQTTSGLTTLKMVDGLAKYGDAAGTAIGIWVMHSAKFYELVKDQITANIDGVTSYAIANASPITLNRPVLVIDSPSLVIPNGVSAGVPSYVTLGLGAGAVKAEDSEDMMLATQLITGTENLSVRIQGEYSYNIGVKGFGYNVGTGGTNPGDAAISTAANWSLKAADSKDLGGVVIETA